MALLCYFFFCQTTRSFGGSEIIPREGFSAKKSPENGRSGVEWKMDGHGADGWAGGGCTAEWTSALALDANCPLHAASTFATSFLAHHGCARQWQLIIDKTGGEANPPSGQCHTGIIPFFAALPSLLPGPHSFPAARAFLHFSFPIHSSIPPCFIKIGRKLRNANICDCGLPPRLPLLPHLLSGRESFNWPLQHKAVPSISPLMPCTLDFAFSH